MARNPALDLTFNCLDYDINGVVGKGILSFTMTLEGELGSLSIFADPLVDVGTIEGELIQSLLFDGELILGGMTLEGEPVFAPPSSSWIKWSDIGSIDFTITNKNLAGERPLDWFGSIYELKKLNKEVIAYGSGGVSRLLPIENTFGLININRIGIKGSRAVAGDETTHFFIDSTGVLWSLADKVTRLGYKEFLSKLTNPIMLLDEINALIYICDGIYGFVYSIKDRSLGQGPLNLTGIEYNNNTQYIIGSDLITTPTVEICTDIFDFTTRKNKTLTGIEFGLNSEVILNASIDFRTAPNNSFVNTGWVPVTPQGIAFINCFGQEFRIRLKAMAYEEMFKIDYIKILGVIHGSMNSFMMIDTEASL